MPSRSTDCDHHAAAALYVTQQSVLKDRGQRNRVGEHHEGEFRRIDIGVDLSLAMDCTMNDVCVAAASAAPK